MKRLKQQKVKVATSIRSCLSSSSSNSSTSSFQFSSQNRIVSSPSDQSSIISKQNIALFDKITVQYFCLTRVLGDHAFKLGKQILKHQLKSHQHEQQENKSASITDEIQDFLCDSGTDSELNKLKIIFSSIMTHWTK